MALPSDKMPRQSLEDILPLRSFWWLLESAPDGIILVDSEGHIMLANAQAEKMFVYTEDELLGRQIEDLIPERFRDIHIQDRADYNAAPRTRPMGIGLELYALRRDGSEFPVEISLSPVQTKAGVLVMAIIRDITEYKREHFIAETLQKAMLSSEAENVSGISIASTYMSAYAEAQVGGDLFDVFTIRPGLIGVAIGDVSGKGMKAAMHTALAKYALRVYAHEIPVPSTVLKNVNGMVYKETEPEIFTTLFFGVLDVKAGVFSFANAGHMPPLLRAAGSNQVSELVAVGIPLGVTPEAQYEQNSTKLKSGDRILFYTDGVTEAWNGKGFYGMDNLLELFRNRGNESPSDFIAHLKRAVVDWSGEHLRDDIAMLLIAME